MKHFVLNEQLWLDHSTVCFLLVWPYSLTLFGGLTYQPEGAGWGGSQPRSPSTRGSRSSAAADTCSEGSWRNMMQLKQFVMKGNAAGFQTPVRQERPFKRHSIHTWHSIPDKFSPFCMNNMHWSKINIFSLICCKLTVVTWPIYNMFSSGFPVLVNPFRPG